MELNDFQIRCCIINNTSAAVIVHSSPSDAMHKSETVKLDCEM